MIEKKNVGGDMSVFLLAKHTVCKCSNIQEVNVGMDK